MTRIRQTPNWNPPGENKSASTTVEGPRSPQSASGFSSPPNRHLPLLPTSARGATISSGHTLTKHKAGDSFSSAAPGNCWLLLCIVTATLVCSTDGSDEDEPHMFFNLCAGYSVVDDSRIVPDPVAELEMNRREAIFSVVKTVAEL